MSLLVYALVASAATALVTWIACRWWYGREIRALHEDVQRARVPALNEEFDARARTADPVVEEALNETPGTSWGVPFLHTSPLTHVEEAELKEKNN